MPLRPVHMADIERRTLDPDLPTARTVEVRYQAGIGLACHGTRASTPHHPVSGDLSGTRSSSMGIMVGKPRSLVIESALARD